MVDRAALIACVAASKQSYALEEQEQQLRRKKEQLGLEAEIATSTAKLAVLQASGQRSVSQATSDGMNSYLEKEKRKREVVSGSNPM